jgi:hypothetical protein
VSDGERNICDDKREMVGTLANDIVLAMEERSTLVERAVAQFETDNPGEVEKSLYVASVMVLSAKNAGLPLDDAFIERASSAVHDAWLARNKAHASETEQRPYAELSEEDKDKDRRFVRAILTIIV